MQQPVACHLHVVGRLVGGIRVPCGAGRRLAALKCLVRGLQQDKPTPLSNIDLNRAITQLWPYV